jgi:hypothetical protein
MLYIDICVLSPTKALAGVNYVSGKYESDKLFYQPFHQLKIGIAILDVTFEWVGKEVAKEEVKKGK